MKSNTELQLIAYKIRRHAIVGVYNAASGHPGGSLSIADILSVLYFDEMNVNPSNPSNPDRDRFVLSKGHAAPVLYSALARKGFFPAEELATLRKFGSRLQGHPFTGTIPEVDATTGLLGQGLSVAVGMAIAKRNNGDNHHVYAIVGDGEMQEGQIWESLLQAAHYKLNNLILVIDYNKLSSYSDVNESINLEPLANKVRAFNFHTLEIDGHDMEQIVNALNEAYQVTDKPIAIICNTVKGKGISYMENNPKWHTGLISDEEYKTALQDLEKAEVE